MRSSLLLLAALSLVPVSAQPLLPFDAPWVAYNTAFAPYNGSPVALAMGDFDNDGDADVVVALAESGSGFVLLRNDGEGRLGAPQHRPSGPNSWGIVAADFNEDGDLDVAITDGNSFQTGSNTVSLFLGNGDGTFGPRQPFPAGAGAVDPVGIAAADFDDDGHLDIAIAPSGSSGQGSTVALLRGDGNGAFAAPMVFPAGPAPYRLEAGDLTGDGRPDLVVANRDYQVSVLRNDGGGGFAAPVAYSNLGENFADNNFPDVALADADGDGEIDVFYANTRTWTNGSTGHAVQLRNNGTGTLTRAADVPFTAYSNGPADLATPDLNDDGAPDLVAANYSGRTADGVMVRLNNGDGTFGPVAHYPAGQATLAVAAADMDGDGTMDLLTVDNYSMAVTVRLGEGDGGFPVVPDDFDRSGQYYLDAADLDGDGDLDVFTSGAGFSNEQGSLLMNDGTGRFPDQTDVVPSDGVSWGKLRDLNGDGRPDLLFNNSIASSQYDFFTAMNNGDGTFPTPTRWAVGSAGWGHVDAFDLDNDGDLDVVDMEDGGCPGCEPKFWVALNTGDGTFGAPYPIEPLPYRPYGVAGGDFNHDGNVDLAMTVWTFYGFFDRVMIALGRGDGTFDTPITPYTVSRGPKEIVTADLDGDGHLDLAVSSTGFDNDGVEGLTVLFGTGSGTFTRIQQYYTPFSPDLLGAGGLRVGDLDADGDLDLMLQAVSNDVSIYVNDGNGVFTFPYRLGFTEGAANPYYGDFTGDGIPELVAVRSRPPLGAVSGVAVLEGLTGIPTTSEPATSGTPTPGIALSAVDPNPFNPQARFTLDLPATQAVRLTVYDTLGREVARLHDGPLAAGTHAFTLDGSRLASGVYVVRAVGDRLSTSRTAVLAK